MAVFVAVDHCSASDVGIHLAIRGTRFEALHPIHQGVRECFGAIGKNVAAGLTIRHDNGSQYISHDFHNEIAWLGLCCTNRLKVVLPLTPDGLILQAQL